MMMTQPTSFLETEVQYRREQIASDYAAARRWELGLRRTGRRIASLWGHGSTSRPGVRRAAAH